MQMTIVPAKLNESKNKIVLLDQTKIPNSETYIELDTREEIFEAIKMLRVRGAPAIGIAAAYGIYVCINKISFSSKEQMKQEFYETSKYLASSRPTAVNLFWALQRMTHRFETEIDKSMDEIKKALLDESEAIMQEHVDMDIAIGEYGLSLLKPDMGLLTHCNAGGLATTGIGTALSPMYLGHQKGYNFRVFADETRPLLQGARLTSYELFKAGIDVTVICDNMCATVMKEGKIDAVLVGCDRIAANGDSANKIGTSGVAILAKEFGIPMYFLGPTSTIDINTDTGNDIEIELRDSNEISNGFNTRTVYEGIKTYNPAFDVTEAKYINAIITEKGIIYPPFKENIAKLFQ